MDFKVLVQDATGAPIAGATVLRTVSGAVAQAVSDGQGQVVLPTMPTQSFTLEATQASYLEEQVTVYPPIGGGSFTWDNPVCAVAAGNIVLQLSRIRAAPIRTMSNSDLEGSSPFGAHGPQAAFTWTDGGGNPTGRYLATFNDVQSSFVAVDHPLLPDTPTDGWGRINHVTKPVTVDPSRNGDLVWLEWGLGRPEPRLSVAVWMPRIRGTTPTQLDFVVFFSPHTGMEYPPDSFPWLEKYPYWAEKGTGALRPGGPMPLVQKYLGLAHRYLFFEKWLVHQLIAAGRQAVVVFPVQMYGTWGPFGELAGVGRLLSEIVHLMHRMGYDGGGISSTDQDRAPLPGYRFGRVGIQASLPKIRRVALSGFSAGVGPIVSMLGTQIGQRLTAQNFAHALFGADVAPFLEAWKEVWDHDAPTGVRQLMDTSLPGWLRQSSDRMARCYQSQYTASGGWIDATPLGAFVSTPPTNRGAASAAERHSDSRCSLVYFPSGYLVHTTTQPELPPVFWKAPNDHQAVPMVTFGHAARLSGLTKP